MNISVIIPFYKGNEYLPRLFTSIRNVSKHVNVIFEVIIVNDSPNETVRVPNTDLDVLIVENEQNLGIQGARINGIKHASADWILMIDQDDELVADGFGKQIALAENADVVVGNGTYILGDVNRKIYNNRKCMEYLIQKNKFVEIRNLIPSPGECLIRKDYIPRIWMENGLQNNGADDWLLWLLLFDEGARFICNELPVYIHNDAGGTNLSANLDKMRESSLDMVEILKRNSVFGEKELTRLVHSIEFKYYQDTKQLSVSRIIELADAFVSNVIYRVKLNMLKGN